MIRYHLARMMGEHKMRITDAARETGLSSRTTVTLLYKETIQKVDLEAIEQICILFDCTVGDLLELMPSVKESRTRSLNYTCMHSGMKWSDS